jgi:hypothetical protein
MIPTITFLQLLQLAVSHELQPTFMDENFELTPSNLVVADYLLAFIFDK